ncbi:MAG: hypothetical protein COB38_11695 [Gammaproteobacteria bacterium]|nr:MAG: hypothetical protein COB38_11695 [Gammaproteobacteria bacterium]
MKLNLLISILLITLTSTDIFADDINKLESYKKSMVTNGVSASSLKFSEKEVFVLSRNADASITRRVNLIESKLIQRLKASASAQNISAKTRPQYPQKASNIDGFSFYSANAYLNYDLDGDGYYSDFTIEFDADYDGGYADVYGVLYYSKNGGPWIEYFETDVFEIHLNDASDDYQVTSRLITDFPTSDYDILIDLYEYGFSGIVATISSDDTQNLFGLPLEDEAHELNSNASQITYVASTISHDADGDNFYTDLTLEYDISTVYSGDLVYAEVILTNSDELWSQTLLTDNFVLGNQTEFIDLILNAGYPAGWYDVQINLINSYTGEIIANAAQDFTSLASLKLESVDNDNHYDTPSASGGSVNNGADSYENGGGAISGYFLFLFFLIGVYIKSIRDFSLKEQKSNSISNGSNSSDR